MQYWEETIYRTIEASGGEADLQDIYVRIAQFTQLTDNHLKATKWGGRPAYQHIVRSYISNMCRSGMLHRTVRGRYKITQYCDVTENQE